MRRSYSKFLPVLVTLLLAACTSPSQSLAPTKKPSPDNKVTTVSSLSPIQVTSPPVALLPSNADAGYGVVLKNGAIIALGDFQTHGDMANKPLNQPIIAATMTSSGQGYWLLASDGGVFSFGDAQFYGSTGSIRLSKPVVGMSTTPSGHGYWLVASDGGVFSFGDAQFFGSMGGLPLNKPVVGMASANAGYWLVAADGGIFAYGDAPFFGSMGSSHLNRPIIGMSASPTHNGYRFVASDGGIFSYGDAPFYGSLGSSPPIYPIVSMQSTQTGYRMLDSRGTVYSFGASKDYGSVVFKNPPKSLGAIYSLNDLGVSLPNKPVALTFDDGPAPITPAFLNVLTSKGVPAIFCTVGTEVSKYPDTLKAEAAAGMGSCNHTQSHDQTLNTAPQSRIDAQIQGGKDAIVSVLGTPPLLYRPPGGALSSLVLDRAHTQGEQLIEWNVDPNDWKRPGTQAIIDRVLSQVRSGSIILMHDGGGDRSQTLAALPVIIDSLRNQGYTFVNLADVIPSVP